MKNKILPSIVILLIFVSLSSCTTLLAKKYKTEADCVIKLMEGKSDLLIKEVRSECQRIIKEQSKNETGLLNDIKFGSENNDPNKNPYSPGTLDYIIWEDGQYFTSP